MILSRNTWWKILKICYWYSLRKLLVMFFFFSGASECFAASHLKPRKRRPHLVPTSLMLQIFDPFQPQFGKGVFLQQSLAILILDTAISVPGTFLKPRSTARYSLLEIAPRILHPYQLKILKGGNDLIIHSSFHQNCERLIEKWPNHVKSLQLNEFLFLPNFHQNPELTWVSTVPIHFLSFENL